LRLVPVNRLSTHKTSCPCSSKRSIRCEPRNPAPPVTRTRFRESRFRTLRVSSPGLVRRKVSTTCHRSCKQKRSINQSFKPHGNFPAYLWTCRPTRSIIMQGRHEYRHCRYTGSFRLQGAGRAWRTWMVSCRPGIVALVRRWRCPVLAWAHFRASQQRIIISHSQIWLHDTYSSGEPACIDRSDVARIEIRQTSLQKLFNTGDLTIHSLMLERPMTIRSIPHVEHLKRRLTRHMKKRSGPVAPRSLQPRRSLQLRRSQASQPRLCRSDTPNRRPPWEHCARPPEQGPPRGMGAAPKPCSFLSGKSCSWSEAAAASAATVTRKRPVTRGRTAVSGQFRDALHGMGRCMPYSV
jgi:hypothetical protein